MKLRSFWHFNRATFFLLDFVLLWAAVLCAFVLSPRLGTEVFNGFWLQPELRVTGLGLPLFMALGLQLVGLQASRGSFRAAETLSRTATGLVVGMGMFLLLNVLIQYQLIGRYVLILSFVYGMGFVVGSRLLVWTLAERTSRTILVYGSRRTFELVETALVSSRLPIRLTGYVKLGAVSAELDHPGYVDLGGLELHAYCKQNHVDEIVVEVPDSLGETERAALLQCTALGIGVMDLGFFYERDMERVCIQELKESWFWSYYPSYNHPVYFIFKRVVDVVLSLLGIIAAMPIATIVAILIKLQDRGPIFYFQVRVGLSNRPFQICKFRTMRVDAEKQGAQWAKQNDNRSTFIGSFLRKTRIDEVPQFWNILRGDMSFIGPRPERPELIARIEKEIPFYRYRHLINPGLTGWAQINYPYGASIEDARQKLSYDFYYIKYASITRDLLIILRTIGAMAKGAR